MFAAVNRFMIRLHARTTLARAEAEESGQTMVEYGLILALISIAAITVMTLLGGSLNNAFNAIIAELP